MNASLDSVPVKPRFGGTRPAAHIPGVELDAAAPGAGPGAAARPADIPVREGVLEIPEEFRLHHGGGLAGLQVAWRLTGPSHAPVVCALGGISANRRVCLGEEPHSGWWSEVAGPGRPLDALRYRILSFDYIGGSGESSGPDPVAATDAGIAGSPQEGARFPSISSYDQAEVLVRLMSHLGVRSLRAIAGGSYGGMVALAFAERYPERVSHLLVIGACDRPHPMATAWRTVQRRIVQLGVACGRGREGLQLARALAMATYRSPEEFGARFGGAPVREAERFVFPVERYLLARGSDFVGRHHPQAFLCLSESIDLHRVDAARIFVPTTAVAVREDQLVPLADIRAMVARLPAGKLHEISSVYGHDAFLKESEQLRRIFTVALGSVS